MRRAGRQARTPATSRGSWTWTGSGTPGGQVLSRTQVTNAALRRLLDGTDAEGSTEEADS